MNKKLQQRIVGSIAILALVILILPHLFSSNEYKVPDKPAQPQNTDQALNTTTHSADDFQSPTISVDPIPTLNDGQSSNDPISENTWNTVTSTTSNPTEPAEPEFDPNVSVAEQLLAQAGSQTQSPKNTNSANGQHLPKIELIGTTQPNNSSSKQPNKPQVASQPKFTWYVQVGSYSSKENANKAMMDYKKRGYSSEVAYLSGQYKVRIGPLKTQDNARNVQAELKRNGVNSYLIQIQ